MTINAGKSNVETFVRIFCKELCRVAETAFGKEGEEEISRYQESTKSLTIRMRISLRAADTIIDSG